MEETLPARDPVAYQAAVSVAGGRPVEEIEAGAVAPDMELLHDGDWLNVKYVHRRERSTTIDFDTVPGSTAWRVVEPGRLMYRRLSNDEAPEALE